MFQYLVFVGAAVNLAGIFFYIKETLKGNTKPNKVTWLMWSLAPLIAATAALASGVGWAVLPVFMAGFCPLLAFIASFVNPKAYWKLGALDYICGFLSMLALILWRATQQPEIAIVFAIASDGLAALPTLTKSWTNPETESGIAYTTSIFNALTSFAAVKTWTFAAYGFPLYLVIVNTAISFAVYRRRFIR